MTLLSILPVQAEGSPSGSGKGEDFGRWEQRPMRCEVQQSGSPEGSAESQDCFSLRLDQQTTEILAFRFVSKASDSPSGIREISFVGMLVAGSKPLRCHEGRCQPRGDLELRVSAVADSGFDGRGLATGVPNSLLAKGRCSLKEATIHCRAIGWGGRQWRADARL